PVALVAAGGLEVSGDGLKDLHGRTLTNPGTANFTGPGSLSIAQGAVFNNTGRFEAQSAAAIVNSVGGTATFANAGTFVKSGAGTTTSISGVTFNNTGTVDVQSGTLSLAGGGPGSGSFTLGAGGILELAGGSP